MDPIEARFPATMELTVKDGKATVKLVPDAEPEVLAQIAATAFQGTKVDVTIVTLQQSLLRKIEEQRNEEPAPERQQNRQATIDELNFRQDIARVADARGLTPEACREELSREAQEAGVTIEAHARTLAAALEEQEQKARAAGEEWVQAVEMARVTNTPIPPPPVESVVTLRQALKGGDGQVSYCMGAGAEVVVAEAGSEGLHILFEGQSYLLTLEELAAAVAEPEEPAPAETTDPARPACNQVYTLARHLSVYFPDNSGAGVLYASSKATLMAYTLSGEEVVLLDDADPQLEWRAKTADFLAALEPPAPASRLGPYPDTETPYVLQDNLPYLPDGKNSGKEGIDHIAAGALIRVEAYHADATATVTSGGHEYTVHPEDLRRAVFGQAQEQAAAAEEQAATT